MSLIERVDESASGSSCAFLANDKDKGCSKEKIDGSKDKVSNDSKDKASNDSKEKVSNDSKDKDSKKDEKPGAIGNTDAGATTLHREPPNTDAGATSGAMSRDSLQTIEPRAAHHGVVIHALLPSHTPVVQPLDTDAGAIGNTDAGAIGYTVPSTKLAKPAKVIRKSLCGP